MITEEEVKVLKTEIKKIEQALSSQDTLKNKDKLKTLNQEYKQKKSLLSLYKEYIKLSKEKEEYKQVLSGKDKELVTLAQEELPKLENKLKIVEKKIDEALFDEDPLWSRNSIVEIRAAAGGDESALFAGDLFRMYSRYSERKGWKLEILSTNAKDIGGYKEIIFLVSGSTFKFMRFESGVHRVQRIPQTETSGRIHTSTATVAVFPETEQNEIQIDSEDIKIEVFRAGGHGGQHVNTTDSAVRITHLPTGVVVSCQDERSQYRNKQKALKILYARIKNLAQKKSDDKKSRERREIIKTGDRSEKIRTYNFPQNRVTDHRINISFYNLNEILDGDLTKLHKELLKYEITELRKRDIK